MAMSRGKSPKTVTLIYGNQTYSVEQAAQSLEHRILGDGPRDFSYHRFDAAEMLRAGGAGAVGESLDAFQIACETMPFLCEQHVVRVDHVEAVRVTDRSVQNLRRTLAEQRVFACQWEGTAAWALEEDLLPTEAHGELMPLTRWVRDVEPRPGEPPCLHLVPDEEPHFVVAYGEGRRLVTLKTFLREKLKGRFAFAEETEDITGTRAPMNASGRLHQLLERFIEQTPPDLYLVLTADVSRESDLSRALLTKVKARGALEKFITYDDYNPVDWVARESKARNVPLSRSASELLIHLVGNDLGRLASELDKLSLVRGDGPPLDEEAIVRAVHGGHGASLFLITDKLASRDLSGALKVLEHFLAETPNEHPVLIGILARFFRQLLQVHALSQLGVAAEEWPGHLKLHPFIARKVVGQAWAFDSHELEAVLRGLAGVDLAVKRHSHLAGPLFREFLHAVCRKGFRTQHPSSAIGLAELI